MESGLVWELDEIDTRDRHLARTSDCVLLFAEVLGEVASCYRRRRKEYSVAASVRPRVIPALCYTAWTISVILH